MSLTVLMILSITASTFSQVPDPPAFERHLYVSGKDTLPYRLLKPERMEAGKAYPLVIFFHGAGERGKNNFLQLRHIADLFLAPANRHNYPCFVVAPQCPEKQWWSNIAGGKLPLHPSNAMKLALQLVGALENDYPIDKSRIYLTGLSMGGFGIWDILSRYPDRFAAAVIVCGGGDLTTTGKISHVPAWVFHGAKDNVVAVHQSRQMVEALKRSGGSPKYTEYSDVMHDSWVKAFREPDLMPWLFAQKNERTP